MRLSTSSSRTPTAGDVVVLLAACALVCITVEVGTAYVFGRVSHIENRRENEYQRALSMRPTRNEHSPSVLVAGNSLLLEGVDFPELQQEVGPAVDLRRAVVENTFYLDWYYGLRRLFETGAQPDAVVLVLNPIQLTSAAIDGDYTAHFMVDRRDLFRFAKDVGADRNRLSSLALANVSFFYGTRAEIRSWILGQILPDLPLLSHSFHAAPKAPGGDALRDVAKQRVGQLRGLCREYKVDLVLVIPPSNEDFGASAVSQAAAEQGVRVLIPIAPGTLPSSDYADRFHLNSHGAQKFTPALALDLKRVLFENTLNPTQTSALTPVSSETELRTTSVKSSLDRLDPRLRGPGMN